VKTPVYTTRFSRDYRHMLSRGKAEAKFATVAARLLAGAPLEPRQRDHPLKGSFAGWRDCHLEPDWILIYRATPTEVIFGRTGTHSDLFG
jgi:mRNA interferase YafQ